MPSFYGKPSAAPPPFNTGDLVCLKNGSAAQVVEGCEYRQPTYPTCSSAEWAREQWCVLSHYASQSPDTYPRYWRPATHFILISCAKDQDAHQAAQQENSKMAKLFQFKHDGKDVFGTQLAKNSAGQLVMEVKGSGDVVAVDPKQATEVKPYTVGVRFINGQSETYHYESTPGEVEVGDIVMLVDGSFVRVVAINTKSDRVTERLTGRKVVTKPLGSESDEG